MKAILLAGGQGTRLRPLTINTPKPIVPIFNRPFLHYQIDLLKQVPEIDEVILSLNYQPRRIEAIFGDGASRGIRIRYVVEPEPLGTGGAVRYAGEGLTESVVVLNGDVLTQVDLAAVIALHRQRQARATIVLTPVAHPEAYGLVETDAAGNIRRFLEKPAPGEITTNHINAGIYVLEPDTFDRIPPGVPWSIERRYFPSLIERRETFVAYVDEGYWIDIGTPDKYTQVHRDIMDGRYATMPFLDLPPPRTAIAPDARIDPGAAIEGPCFIDGGVVVRRGARVGPYSVIGRDTQIDEGASVEGAILWPECRIGRGAVVRDAIVGRGSRLGDGLRVDRGAVLGDETVLTDHARGLA
ncbi:MAG: NDP-sugar synthase [Acidobacteria bacterium]|nr:NDP-sugar synthase [Acidobacteriota bacterium]